MDPMLTPNSYKMRNEMGALHIIGTAHSIPNGDYPTDPFTNKAMTFSRVFTEAGFTTYYYGVEGGEDHVKCTKYIPFASKEIFFETYPTVESTTATHFSTTKGKVWEEFFKNTPNLVQENLLDGARDIIFPFFGSPCAQITNKVGICAIEPGIGHPGSYCDIRIFESYAWQNFTYGKEGRDDTKKWPTHYSTTIPNMIYPEEYPFSEEKEDYFMFMGRINWGKGISLAAELSNHFEKKLIIAGAGDIRAPHAIPSHIPIDHVEYVGILNHKEKCDYLKKAKAFFCPSQYIEPFGHVVPEASVCGTPILTTDFGAFSETVIDGVTGFRCRVMQDFIDGINRIDEIDPLTCRKSAIDRFGYKALLPKYLKFFDQVLTMRLDEQGWYKVY